jgi:hypothetical protein
MHTDRSQSGEIANSKASRSGPRLPDFLIIGATRCGTTSLHRYIGEHPQVFVPSTKELHFFDMDRNFNAGLEWYCAHFAEAHSGAIIGESTPAYLNKGMLRDSDGKWYASGAEDCGTRIKDALPNAKLIVSLRNPVDRLYSQYCKHLYQGYTTLWDVDLWLEAQSQGFSESYQGFSPVYQNRYSVHLIRWLSLFPREQLHFVIFEHWTREPAAMFSGLCDFLGIERFTPQAFSAHNTGESIRSRHTADPRTNWLGRLLRSGRGRRPLPCPKMPLATKKMLTARFGSDIEKTEELIGADLSIWRDVDNS